MQTLIQLDSLPGHSPRLLVWRFGTTGTFSVQEGWKHKQSFLHNCKNLFELVMQPQFLMLCLMPARGLQSQINGHWIDLLRSDPSMLLLLNGRQVWKKDCSIWSKIEESGQSRKNHDLNSSKKSKASALRAILLRLRRVFLCLWQQGPV